VCSWTTCRVRLGKLSWHGKQWDQCRKNLVSSYFIIIIIIIIVIIIIIMFIYSGFRMFYSADNSAFRLVRRFRNWILKWESEQSSYTIGKCLFVNSSESSGMYCRVLNWMSTDVSEVLVASVIRALMIETASTSETSVDIQLTRQYIPEDSELHTRRRENLKSHVFVCKLVSWLTVIYCWGIFGLKEIIFINICVTFVIVMLLRDFGLYGLYGLFIGMSVLYNFDEQFTGHLQIL
jgi:hypothetical protein